MSTRTSKPHSPPKTEINESVVRLGRTPVGLYPHISRKHLAELTGYHISSIAGILLGRTKPNLAAAIKIAEVVGVSVEELSGELEKAQAQFKQRGERASGTGGAKKNKGKKAKTVGGKR